MAKTLVQNDTNAMTTAMARNLAAWTDSSVRAYDIPTFTNESLWWRQPGGPGIYLAACTIDLHSSDENLYAELNRVVAAWGPREYILYDCWATRDVSALGFEKIVQNPWYLRRPGPLQLVNPPAELSIEVVTTAEQLELFEEASRLGFDEMETPDPSWEAFSWHHPATLADPGMTYLIGKVNERVVSSVIAHATEDMVGIYGLSTLPQFRRKGYAAALVYAAVALHPELPASVFPDPPSVPIYTRIGFARADEIAIWKK